MSTGESNAGSGAGSAGGSGSAGTGGGGGTGGVTRTRRAPPRHTGLELHGLWLVEELGAGAMGKVWLGFDPRLERYVAIKTMKGEIASDPLSVQRFEREARAIAKLSHPNIVQIFHIGEEKGELFLVMEYIDGPTLSGLVKEKGPLGKADALRVVMQAADALGYANEYGVLHRDIKPGNIMLGEGGRVKITDFGLAKLAEGDGQLTTTGAVLGSPSHMSPEACKGEHVDFRTDIYSLGITFFQILTGQTPYSASSSMALMYKQINEPLPEPPTLRMMDNGVWMDTILRMTAKAKEDRFQSYGELRLALDSLEAVVKGEQGAATGISSLFVPGVAGSRSKISVTAATRVRPGMAAPRGNPSIPWGKAAIGMCLAALVFGGGMMLMNRPGGRPRASAPPPASAAQPRPTSALPAPSASAPVESSEADEGAPAEFLALLGQVPREFGLARRAYDFDKMAAALQQAIAANPALANEPIAADLLAVCQSMADFKKTVVQQAIQRPNTGSLNHATHGTIFVSGGNEQSLQFKKQDGTAVSIRWDEMKPVDVLRVAQAFWQPGDFKQVADTFVVVYPGVRRSLGGGPLGGPPGGPGGRMPMRGGGMQGPGMGGQGQRPPGGLGQMPGQGQPTPPGPPR